MNITVTQKQNDTLLTIEADFDKFVAENFDEICQALAKRFKILAELETSEQTNYQSYKITICFALPQGASNPPSD